MPTYLLAFIVSKLVKSNYTTRNSETPSVEIWTRPENKDMTNYAYSMFHRFNSWFENYFGSKNILKKVDMVSLPEFGFGAMENWGLITFR